MNPNLASPVNLNPDQPYKILVVEDDPFIRQLNSDCLTQAGFEVNAAPDGAAGWYALHRRRYDLLVTDNHMPRLSGIQLIKNLRVAEIRLPVILASGGVPSELVLASNGLKLAAILPKPFTPEQLLATVRGVLASLDGNYAHARSSFARSRTACPLVSA